MTERVADSRVILSKRFQTNCQRVLVKRFCCLGAVQGFRKHSPIGNDDSEFRVLIAKLFLESRG